MKEFFRLLRRFVPPYKKYLIWALFLNLLSAILNIFSFALIIPILQILFKMDTKTYEFIPWDAERNHHGGRGEIGECFQQGHHRQKDA